MNIHIRAAFMLAAIIATPAFADDLSTSVMRPTALDPASGLITGKLPGGQGSTSWWRKAPTICSMSWRTN